MLNSSAPYNAVAGQHWGRSAPANWPAAAVETILHRWRAVKVGRLRIELSHQRPPRHLAANKTHRRPLRKSKIASGSPEQFYKLRTLITFMFLRITLDRAGYYGCLSYCRRKLTRNV